MEKMMKCNKTLTDAAETTSFSELGPDQLKDLFHTALLSMKFVEREEFIRTLESEMTRANFPLPSYLIPLGIPGCTPAELTPREVGHLIRFLKMIVPSAIAVVERVAARYDAFRPGDDDEDRFAA
jgi:hypothetical protein